MKSLLLTVALIVSTAAPAFGISNNQQVGKCLDRIMVRCGFSIRDIRNLQNVTECKQIRPDLDVAVLVSGNLAAFNGCRATKFDIDGSGIVKSKEIQQKLYLLGADGKVFFMSRNEKVYEVLNSRRQSYSSVVDIKGDANGGTSINFMFSNGQSFNIGADELEAKAEHGDLRPVTFFLSPNVWSVFN